MKTSFLLIVLILLGTLCAKSQISPGKYSLTIDSANVYPTIDKILELKELKNKVVYVDIWGTRCPPCLKEFQELPSLKHRFQNDAVVFLYLCSPYTVKRDKQNEKLWRELILKNDLKGINILISSECYGNGFFEKYKDKYSEKRRYGIPTYLLVDKKGKIRDFDAPRPSKGVVLYDEIQKLLKE